MKKTQVITIVLVLGITTLLVALLLWTKPQPIKQKDGEVLPTVEHITVVPRTVVPNYTSSGRLQPTKISELEFEVDGRVINRLVEAGAPVRQGQVLLMLDASDYRDALTQAQARRDIVAVQLEHDKKLLALALDNVVLQQREVKRIESLLQRKHVSPSLLDTEKKRLVDFQSNQVKLQHSIQKGEIDLALNTSILERARRDLQRTNLVAPFSGTVNEITVEVGDYISKGKKVVRLVDISRFDLLLHVANEQVVALKLDSIVPVTVGGKLYQGKLIALQENPDYQTNTHKVKISLEGNHLQAGATAQATLAGVRLESVLTVPVTAIQYVNGQPFVFVVENGVVSRKAVVLGLRVGNEIVVEHGIVAGEQVVSRDVEKLNNNQRVIAEEHKTVSVKDFPK